LDKPFRYERKYLISTKDYHEIRSRLKKIVDLDKNAGEKGEYFIRSLYFDDINDTAYAEKLDGRCEKEKFRIRIYNCSDKVIKLEKKEKAGFYNAKASETIDLETCRALIAGRPEAIPLNTSPLVDEFCAKMRVKLLRPKVIVDYNREAYTSPFSRTRITFDKNLRTGNYATELFDPNLPTLAVMDKGYMLMEVKFDEYMPTHISNILSMTNATQTSFSKYAMCRKFQ